MTEAVYKAIGALVCEMGIERDGEKLASPQLMYIISWILSTKIPAFGSRLRAVDGRAETGNFTIAVSTMVLTSEKSSR